jgi:hypothetical protein
VSTPSEPITLEPALWYDVTVRDDNEECENYGKEFQVNPCYSNAGTVLIQCGKCKHTMTMVSATLLDPQPEVS